MPTNPEDDPAILRYHMQQAENPSGKTKSRNLVEEAQARERESLSDSTTTSVINSTTADSSAAAKPAKLKMPDAADLFWDQELKKQTKEGWYLKALHYWDAQEASVNGVLGGYGHTTGPDLRESGRLVKLLRGRKDVKFGFGRVLDCGAGIGRISEGLLLKEFDTVDLLEPCGKLIVEGKRKLGGKNKVGNFYPYSLQDFNFCGERHRVLGEGENPREVDEKLRKWQSEEMVKSSSNNSNSNTTGNNVSPNGTIKLATETTLQYPPVKQPLKYDCIWNQWVLLYLTDQDLIAYMKRCIDALENKETGWIFCKENVLPIAAPNTKTTLDQNLKDARGFEIDIEDNGLTRSDDRYRMLFEKAGLEIVCALRQSNWPSDLYPVYMYVLKPNKGVLALESKAVNQEAK